MFKTSQEVIWIKTGERVNIEEANKDPKGNWYYILTPDKQVYEVAEKELQSIN